MGSIWGRFGRRFGLQNRPKSLHFLTSDGLDFDLVVGWSQDGRQDHLNRALGWSWAVLGPSWGGLGLLLGAFGLLLGGLRARFGSFGGRFGAVLGFDSLMRFVASIQ